MSNSPAAQSAEARNILRELDEELAAASKRTGKKLVWTAPDRTLLRLIADTVDRKVDLEDAYKQTVETKFKLKLSAEIRLLETSLARLIKQVQTDVPAPEGIATIKARRAANIRWERERAQG